MRTVLEDAAIGTPYAIYEQDWTGEDGITYSDYKGYVYLEYTRKTQSDLDGMNPWKILVTVNYEDQGNTVAEVLEISWDDGNDVVDGRYMDYFEVPIPAIADGYEVTIKSISGEYYNGTSWVSVSNPQNDLNFPIDVDFRLELRATDWYNFTVDDEDDMPVLAFDNSTYRVSWSFVEGAEWYDLEWVFIDFYSDEYAEIEAVFNNSANLQNGGYDDPFELKEPSRVRVWKTHHILDQTFPKGALYFRVRSVSKYLDGSGPTRQLKLGDWTYFDDPSVLSGSFTSSNVIHEIISGAEVFEEDKNWLFGVAYAEEGKSVSSLTYYDGSNRGRQSLTYNTSDDVTLIGESKFDYEGRQTVSVIPAPIQGREFGYRTNFNMVNVGGLLENFDENDLDSANYIGANEPQIAATNPVSPSDVMGAGQYFSPYNKLTDDLFRAAIPDANGYVYSQTVYRNDGSGRIERVGGIGEEFQVGGDHAIQTFYVSPTATELIRLFGSNVPGNLNGYRKEVVRDANGQYSVTYYDKRGNVIATGIAGESPTNLVALENQNAADYWTTILDNNTSNGNYAMIAEHTHLNLVENAEISLTYDIESIINTIDTQTVTVGGESFFIGELCSTCRYDLSNFGAWSKWRLY